MASSSSDEEESIELDVPGLFRLHKNGRFTRLTGTDKLPPSVDPSTGVSSKDIAIATAPFSVRLYLPPAALPPSGQKLPLLIYFHGGAFCLESSASPTYHRHLNTLSALTPSLALSVDYRLAPEHPLPAAYDDSLAAIRWALSSPDPWLADHADLTRVFLAGDSAGANIAHHMALRSEVRFKGVALIHPYFWGSEPVGGESGDLGLRGIVDRMWTFVCPDSVGGADDPRINFMAGDAAGLAGLRCERVLVAVAERDLLRFRGRAYYERLKESGWGGEAELVEAADAEHVFHLFHPEADEAKKMIRVLVDFFNKE